MKQRIPSALSAASSPALQAAPKPRTGSSTTRAPWARAMAPEPSSEPLSTTMGVKPAGMAARSPGSAAASLRTGMTTSGTARLYTAASLCRPRKCSRFCEQWRVWGVVAWAVGQDRQVTLTTDPPRVLVVEDDPTVADVVMRYLQREGYRVDVVS